MARSVFFLVFLLNCSISHQGFGQSNSRSSLSEMALSIIDPTIIYDPTYFSIPYPNGDVPLGRGVCTDVIIRAFRKLDLDLQQIVHEDMQTNFNLYPNNWGLRITDTNIDHRRVPNLMTFFTRNGEEKPITMDAQDYQPGDIVCWDLGGGITHIGIMVNKRSSDGKRFMVVHNIGRGQVLEDILFLYRIIGHYTYPK